MAQDYNRCTFTGRLSADPEVRYLPSDKTVCNFKIACNGYKDGEVEWIPVVCWNKVADNVGKYMQKGSPVLVDGRWQTRSWEDNDGNRKYITEIVASTVQFLGGKQSSNMGGSVNQRSSNGYPEPPMPQSQEDDIPF